MALEMLLSQKICDEVLIARHPESTHLKYNSGKCKQFRANGESSKMIKIPERANYFKFRDYIVHGDYGKHVTHIEYGEIVFYDHNDNILKVEKIR
jgi:hypothetical protein